MAIIGSCSICGGNVTVPDAWYGIHPPVPKCDSCGAVKRNRPVIDMEPLPQLPSWPAYPYPSQPIMPLGPYVPTQPRPDWDRWVPPIPVTCKMN